MDLDLVTEPLGTDAHGEPVFLADVWPAPADVRATVEGAIGREMFERTPHADVYTGDPEWRELPVPEGSVFAWEEDSTYVRRPPYFDGMSREPVPWRTSTEPAASSRSATPSRPTTSPPPGRSGPTARPAATSSSTGSSGPTSTPTARAAGTTR